MCCKVVVHGITYAILLMVCVKISDSGRIKRIVGGMPVMCGEQRRVVSLRNASNNEHLCGAIILTPGFAVTAAHCVQHAPVNYVLQLNNFCIAGNNSYPEAKIMDVITHDKYDKYTRAHDISILQIRLALDDVTWLNDSVLPTSSFGLSGQCSIYGYGYSSIKEVSDTLQAAIVDIVSLDYCTAALGQYVAPQYDSGMICALGDRVDTCQGDSGGPLFCKNSLLEGISSYGMGCAVPGLPGVYTSIGAHIRWINDIISKER